MHSRAKYAILVYMKTLDLVRFGKWNALKLLLAAFWQESIDIPNKYFV